MCTLLVLSNSSNSFSPLCMLLGTALGSCSNYLSHVLAKLDDNSVLVKKAAIKAMRQYPGLIAGHSYALQRLTRFLNTFAEESQVQLAAFILIGEANRLSVFDHLSPLLSLLHCRDTKILMKTINCLGRLGANCIHLIPSAINRTKSHEMRRRLLSLLIKFSGFGSYDIFSVLSSPLLPLAASTPTIERGLSSSASARRTEEAIEVERRKEEWEKAAKKRKEMEYEEKEIEYLFKNKDSPIKRQAFRMMASHYLYTMVHHYTTTALLPLPLDGDVHNTAGETENTRRRRDLETREFAAGESGESAGVGAPAAGVGGGLFPEKYRKILCAILKDKNHKSRMEGVLALGQLLARQHREAVLRLLFPGGGSPGGAAKPLLSSVAVWRMLSHNWQCLIAIPQ